MSQDTFFDNRGAAPQGASGRGGNTIPPSPRVGKGKHGIRARRWCFTWNNYSASDIDLLLGAFEDAEKYAFQEEKVSTQHLQGCVEFRYQKAFESLKKISDKIHWEKCKNWDKSVEYCTDPHKRMPGGKVWTKGLPKPLKDPIIVPKPWQQVVINEVQTEPDDRTINWLWEEKGGVGKTALCKHLVMKHKALYVLGEAKDIKYAIAKMVEDKKDIPIVLWDIPRCSYGSISYAAIEQIKNGIFFSGKYESGQVVFNPPHIYISANQPPDISQLSLDRWRIMHINEA